MEIRVGIGESRGLQLLESLDIPLSDILFTGIDIDGIVEKIGYEDAPTRLGVQGYLQRVSPLDYQDVGLPDTTYFSGYNIVIKMRIDRRFEYFASRLCTGQKRQ